MKKKCESLLLEFKIDFDEWRKQREWEECMTGLVLSGDKQAIKEFRENWFKEHGTEKRISGSEYFLLNMQQTNHNMNSNAKTAEETISPVVVETIAQVCHETNRAYCQTIGDDSQKSWKEAEDWQRQSAIAGVYFRLNNRFATPEDQHVAWMEKKVQEGWVFGEVKDSEKKTHPCIVSYAELPGATKLKDLLFQGIVDSFAESLNLWKSVVADPYTNEVIDNKSVRRAGDDLIQRVKNLPSSRERALAITKFQEGVMWMGMDLKRLNETNPYPSSKDPSTGAKIEPTADGLKL